MAKPLNRNALAVAVVQARFGSSRLPGKVLLDLAGRTVLSRVLERVSSVPGIDRVVCAVPDTADSDPVAGAAAACGVDVFRGSEKDVLDRTYGAAKRHGPQFVMRVTSDCPLIDPAVCGDVLRIIANGDADYANNVTPPSFPHGLDCEAFTFDWLARAAREARKPSEREHVTLYIRDHEACRCRFFVGPGGDAPNYRWTLDTPADFEFLRALYRHLPDERRSWNYQVPLAIVRAHPDLAQINAGYGRDVGLLKSLAEDIEQGYE